MNIWMAASDGDLEAVKTFLAEGGDVNAKDENGYTPLQAAVSYSHAELVVFLLQNGATVMLGDNENDTALHVCEKVEIAKILLAHGAELNARNAEGRTPYDAAIEDEHEELVSMYEALGAEKSDLAEGDEDTDDEMAE
ncbi:Ankyrin repeat-containing protein [Globisporangium polare]